MEADTWSDKGKRTEEEQQAKKRKGMAEINVDCIRR